MDGRAGVGTDQELAAAAGALPLLDEEEDDDEDVEAGVVDPLSFFTSVFVPPPSAGAPLSPPPTVLPAPERLSVR